MNKNQKGFNILLCLIIAAGLIIFDGIGAGLCQTSENWTIHTQVTDSGGGTCDSDNYRLCFSLGQTSPVGICAGNSQCLSAGFITGAAKKTPQAKETSADSSSKGNNSCFIRILMPD